MTSTNAAGNRVAVIGLGFVGQANAIALLRMGYQVWGKDVATVPNIYETPDFDCILRQEYPFAAAPVPVLVCVNAHNNGDGQDLGPARAALAEARQLSRGPVILRTTVMPRLLASLDFDIYLPEFLHERHALREVQFPELLVFGYASDAARSHALPPFVEEWRQNARKCFEGSPEECAYVKYLSNLWNAFRIGFVNEFGDAVVRDKLGADQEKILDFLLERAPYLRYGKAFGGHCLPKDSEAFLAEHPYMQALEGLVLSNRRHAQSEEAQSARELFYGEE